MRIRVYLAKVEVITQLPIPRSQKEVRIFLGHAGYYSRFIKNFTKIATPLSNCLPKMLYFPGIHISRPHLIS